MFGCFVPVWFRIAILERFFFQFYNPATVFGDPLFDVILFITTPTLVILSCLKIVGDGIVFGLGMV